MPDDKSKKGPQDSSRINVNELYELQYWSEKFSVTPGEIKAAVDKVGPAVKNVEKELKNSVPAAR